MLYHVSRNGENYGPYTLEDLRKYVASGNITPTDMAKSDDMADWVPVSQILGMAAPAAPAYQPPIAGGYPTSNVAVYPDPPNLHWALVLVIGIFTCGLFCTVWDFVQSAWMRKVNPRSNALFFYIAEFVVSLLGGAGRGFLMFTSAMHHASHSFLGVGLGTFVIGLTLLELARFDMRRSMEEHYNGPEPIGLSLSGVMTFFFGIYYFQYHFNRINELKRMARYRGATI
jgi:hypothetical protein